MKQHQSLMQRCIDMEFTQSDQQRWISSLTRSYSILSNPAIVLVIHCLPIVFLLSQRYLESSTQHQSNKETSNTSSLSLSPMTSEPFLETIVCRIIILHPPSSPQTPTLPRDTIMAHGVPSTPISSHEQHTNQS